MHERPHGRESESCASKLVPSAGSMEKPPPRPACGPNSVYQAGALPCHVVPAESDSRTSKRHRALCAHCFGLFKPFSSVVWTFKCEAPWSVPSLCGEFRKVRFMTFHRVPQGARRHPRAPPSNNVLASVKARTTRGVILALTVSSRFNLHAKTKPRYVCRFADIAGKVAIPKL